MRPAWAAPDIFPCWGGIFGISGEDINNTSSTNYQ